MRLWKQLADRYGAMLHSVLARQGGVNARALARRTLAGKGLPGAGRLGCQRCFWGRRTSLSPLSPPVSLRRHRQGIAGTFGRWPARRRCSFLRGILLQCIIWGMEHFEGTGLFPEAMRMAASGGPLVKSDHLADAAAAAGKGAAGPRDKGLPPRGAYLP